MRIVNSEWSRLQISASVGRMLVSVKIASKILHFSLSCEFVPKKPNVSNLSNSFEFKRASQRFGSGSYSGSFNHKAKIIRILIWCFRHLFEFLSLQNDVIFLKILRAVLWIRIHCFRIRIKSLPLETNTDSDPQHWLRGTFFKFCFCIGAEVSSEDHPNRSRALMICSKQPNRGKIIL